MRAAHWSLWSGMELDGSPSRWLWSSISKRPVTEQKGTRGFSLGHLSFLGTAGFYERQASSSLSRKELEAAEMN